MYLPRSTNEQGPTWTRTDTHRRGLSVSVRVRPCLVLGLILLLFPGPATAQPDTPASFWQRATIYRDGWGVPHIEARDVRAMAFAFGYAQAQDHLKDMLLAYRVANGRAAAVLGEAYAASDVFALKMGHGRLAAAALEKADPVTGDLCEGFAMGVNAWLVKHPGDAPDWAEGVQPPDILALWHAFVMSFAKLDLPGVWQPPPAMPTANAWALAPKRTDEGKSLLVINPHEYHDGPFRWYEAHLSVGDMDVAGATLFGLPVIVMGHNPALGWAMTPNKADFADVFEERLTFPRPRANELRTAGIALERAFLLRYYASAEPYYVRTTAGLEERFTPTLSGPRGPLFEQGASLYSWRVGGYGEFGGLRQLVEMARATNLDAFQQALSAQQIPCFNILYADRAGRLFLIYNARVGDKPASRVPAAKNPMEQRRPVDWKTPLPAAFAENAWRTIVPPGRLPMVLDPASGYMQACGSPPWFATEKSGLRAEDWPFWFVGETDNYRARRVRQLLRAGLRSQRDMESMLYDASVPAAMDLVPGLVEAVKQRSGILGGPHPDLPWAINLLRDWNHMAATDSEAMTFYHVWWSLFQTRVAAKLSDDNMRYGALAAGDRETWDAAVMAADDAVRRMINQFQTIHVPWGRVHRIVRGARDEAASGALTGEPVFLASDSLYRNGKWVANQGYGFAMVVSFGESPEAVSVVPFGASENPDSPHFDDQLDLMLEKRFKRVRFRADEVKRYAAEAMGRRIRLYPLGIQGAATIETTAPVTLRLESTPDAPAPLPDGLAAFTPFVVPRWEPAPAGVRVRYDFVVPPVLCQVARLAELRFQGWTADGQWKVLERQRFDAATGVFTASAPGGLTVAILGPKEYLEVPEVPSPETIGMEEGDTPTAPPAEAAPPDSSEPAEAPDRSEPRFNFNQKLSVHPK